MARHDPAVLPFKPARGWSSAGDWHRLLVWVTVPVLALDCAAIYLDQVIVHTILLAVTIVCFGAVARVLRPYPVDTRQIERRMRHGLSAASLVLGGELLLIAAVFSFPGAANGYMDGDGEGDILFASLMLALLGFFTGIATILWGVVASLTRAGLNRADQASGPGGSAVGDDQLTGGTDPAGRDALVTGEQRP